MSDGVKWDQGKPRMDLLIHGVPDALLEVGEVLSFGAAKYGDHNWKTVPQAQLRYRAAQVRHALAKEELDPESGRAHLAHEICCLLFMLQLRLSEEKACE